MRTHGCNHQFELGNAIGDVLAVAADAVLAVAELLAPVEEVFPGAGGLDAEFFELMRGEGEEGFVGAEDVEGFEGAEEDDAPFVGWRESGCVGACSDACDC